MNLVNTNNKKLGKIYTDKNDILNIITDVISSVSFLDENTLSIKLNKNLISHNTGHMVTINDGLNIRIAEAIHENPNIEKNKFFETPKEIPNMVEKANKEARDKYIQLLKSQGVIINEDGSFDLSNSVYNSCQS